MRKSEIIFFVVYSVIYILIFLFPEAEVGVQEAFIGGIIRSIGGRRNQKRLMSQRRSMEDRISEIKEHMPELDINPFLENLSGVDQLFADNQSFAEQELNRATFNTLGAGGRPAGDDIQRSAAQKATSNAVANAVEFSGNAASLANIVGFAQEMENERNREIDAQSLARIDANINQAEERRARASANRLAAGDSRAAGGLQIAQSKNNLGLQAFEINELNPYLQAANDARALEAAINGQAVANIEALGSAGDSLFNLGTQIASGGFGGRPLFG